MGIHEQSEKQEELLSPKEFKDLFGEDKEDYPIIGKVLESFINSLVESSTRLMYPPGRRIAIKEKKLGIIYRNFLKHGELKDSENKTRYNIITRVELDIRIWKGDPKTKGKRGGLLVGIYKDKGLPPDLQNRISQGISTLFSKEYQKRKRKEVEESKK